MELKILNYRIQRIFKNYILENRKHRMTFQNDTAVNSGYTLIYLFI